MNVNDSRPGLRRPRRVCQSAPGDPEVRRLIGVDQLPVTAQVMKTFWRGLRMLPPSDRAGPPSTWTMWPVESPSIVARAVIAAAISSAWAMRRSGVEAETLSLKFAPRPGTN